LRDGEVLVGLAVLKGGVCLALSGDDGVLLDVIPNIFIATTVKYNVKK
jgi:hypothetical protein